MIQQQKSPKHWLITGGCGFIGTSLIYHLKQQTDCSIRVVDNLSAGTREDLARVCDFTETDKPHPDSDSVELWVGDIRDAEFMLRAAQDRDCIVHLAANTGVIPSIKHPRDDCETNVLGTLNVLEAARMHKVRSFIFASSGAPLGEQKPPIHEEKVPRPLSPYGASKLSGEGYCSAYHGSFGLNTIALRFGNVYGPRSGHKNSVVAKFIRQAFRGETLTVYGDGTQTRDFIYIDDLVDAILKASLVQAGGEIIQIATNREHTVNEILEYVKVIFQEDYNINVQSTHAPPRKGEVMRNYSDISKARKLLDWEPSSDIQDNLRKTVEWFWDISYKEKGKSKKLQGKRKR